MGKFKFILITTVEMERVVSIMVTGALVVCLCATFSACSKNDEDHAVQVIFETDMGNDIDDALALDMLYKYIDQEKIDLLAISTNKNNDYSSRFIGLMNTWYGHPSIPIGRVQNGVDSEGDARNYAKDVCEYQIDGQNAFEEGQHNFYESVSLYRKVLSKQPDNSLVIISVGFSTNLAKLLDSEADKYSSLTGTELVAQKVKLLSMMAGNFSLNPPKLEYNIIKDISAAKKVFAEWPSQIVTSPFEVGDSILFPASSIENDFQWAEYHPLVIGYKNYLPMPYDRQTWDLTAVLYAIESDRNYFSESENGIISVDENGYTTFKEQGNGNHTFLSVNPEQQERIKSRFIELITRAPKKFAKGE